MFGKKKPTPPSKIEKRIASISDGQMGAYFEMAMSDVGRCYTNGYVDEAIEAAVALQCILAETKKRKELWKTS